MQLILLFAYVALALAVSFLCSLLEAVLLSVRSGTLIEKKNAGSRGAGLLLETKHSRLDDAISSILTLNTISNTAGATLAGSQAVVVFGNYIGIFTGVLTFLVLVISEIIPKTLGAVYAHRLCGFVGRVLYRLIALMTPILVVTRALTRLIAPHARKPMSRAELSAIVTVAGRQGTLAGHESALFENVLRFEEIQVDDVMTPRTVAFMLPAQTTIGELVDHPEAAAYSRIPLYERSLDHVVGYVVHREILLALARGKSRDTRLLEFKRDVWFIPEVASMVDAVRQFQEHREPIAMVADEHGGVSGLVTLEDLIETAFGVEIMDESDRVADLRHVAAALRDRRLERKQRVAHEAPIATPTEPDATTQRSDGHDAPR